MNDCVIIGIIKETAVHKVVGGGFPLQSFIEIKGWLLKFKENMRFNPRPHLQFRHPIPHLGGIPQGDAPLSDRGSAMAPVAHRTVENRRMNGMAPTGL